MNTSRKQLRRKQRIALHGGGFTVVCIVAGFELWGFTAIHRRRTELDLEHQRVVQLVHDEADIRAKHAQLHQSLQQLQANDRYKIDLAANTPNDAQFLAQLSHLTGKFDLSIKDYSPGQLTADGLDVQFIVLGRYANLCRLLDGLEAVESLCEVTQCSLNAPVQTGDACTLELRVRILHPSQVVPKQALAGSAL